MQDYLPPVPNSADINAAYNILALLSDPESFKAQLDQINQAATNAQSVLDNVASERSQYQDLLTSAQAAQTAAAQQQAVLDAMQSDLNKLQSDLYAKADDLNTKASALASREAESNDNLTKREIAVSDREASIEAREKVVTSREATADDLIAKTTALQEDYFSRLANLKSIIA